MSDKWSVMAVGIIRESYYWIEDWVKYHIDMGATKVSIYDNTGSTSSSCYRGNGIFQKNGISKRGEKYKELTSHLSDEQIYNEVKSLEEKYKDVFYLITWQPRNEKGEICHAQTLSYIDYIGKNMNSHITWTAFIDLDEYLWFKPGHSMSKLFSILKEKHPNVSIIQMDCRKFRKRWSDNGPNDIKTFDKYLIFIGHGIKNIVKLNDVKDAGIHYTCNPVKDKTKTRLDINHGGFYHYNGTDIEFDKHIQQTDLDGRLFLKTPINNTEFAFKYAFN